MFLTPCNRDITEQQFDLYDNDATKHVLDFYNSDTCTAEHVFDLNNSDTTEYVFDLDITVIQLITCLTYITVVNWALVWLCNSDTTEHVLDLFKDILIGARLTSVRAARVWAM